MKVRSVDHYSWPAGHRRSKQRRKEISVNGHCLLTEKIIHDHVDDIVSGTAKLERLVKISCEDGCVNICFRPGDLGSYHGYGNWMLIQRADSCHLPVVSSGPRGLHSGLWNKCLWLCIGHALL